MKFSKHFLTKILLVTIIAIIGLGAYVAKTYVVLEKNITSIEIVLSGDLQKEVIPNTYVINEKSEKLDFRTPYHYIKIKDSLFTTSISDGSKLRRIRLYFEKPSENLAVHSIRVKTPEETRDIDLNKIKHYERLKLNKSDNGYYIKVQGKHAFIELPKGYIYTSDFQNIYLLVCPLLFLIIIITLVIIWFKPIDLKPINIQTITVSILITSIFLPEPLYNIALILLAILNVKSISWNAIKTRKGNLLILGIFMVYLLNNLLISNESFSEFSTIERFLPFAVLGIVLPSISNRKFLILFPVSAFIIGFWLLLTSTFDVYVHQNFEFLSFNNFAKYLHPVYFSYLLFFSICYINLVYKNKLKYILELILFIFLIFSGSKMVFLFSLIVVLINLIKNKKLLIVIFPLIIVVLLFSPLKKRFDEILKIEDLTILSEKHINNPNDARINGLTLRLLLWREALATMKTTDFFIGKGVTKETNKILSKRLSNLGLKSHVGFNPHNQYVDTFWRTGFLGFFVLIAIPLYSFVLGLRNKDKLLIQFSLFMIAVMFSESIFGRVNGIYFFTTVILILINSSQLHENRNIRN